MEDLKNWLAGGREYASGVQLYLKYGSDELLKKLFTLEAETVYKRDRLQKALLQIYQAAPDVFLFDSNGQSFPMGKLIDSEGSYGQPIIKADLQQGKKEYTIVVPIRKKYFFPQPPATDGQEEKTPMATIVPDMAPVPIGETTIGSATLESGYTAVIDLKEDPNHFPQLEDKIQHLLERAEAAEKETIRRKGWSNPMQAEEAALFEKWKPLYGELMDLQSTMYELAKAGTTDPKKKEAAGRQALRILELDTLCDEIYAARDHFLKHGSLPDENADLDLSIDPMAWPRLLENHKRYLRQYEGKLKRGVASKEPEAFIKQCTENIDKQKRYVQAYKKLLKIQ
jgi:hypothetical protein